MIGLQQESGPFDDNARRFCCVSTHGKIPLEGELNRSDMRGGDGIVYNDAIRMDRTVFGNDGQRTEKLSQMGNPRKRITPRLDTGGEQ